MEEEGRKRLCISWLAVFIWSLITLVVAYFDNALGADEVWCGSDFPCKSYVIFAVAFATCWAVSQFFVMAGFCIEACWCGKNLFSSTALTVALLVLNFLGLCGWTAVIVVYSTPKSVKYYTKPKPSAISTANENGSNVAGAILTGILICGHFGYTLTMALAVWSTYEARLAERKRNRKKALKAPMYEVVPAPWVPPIPQQPVPFPGPPQAQTPTAEPLPTPMPTQAAPIAKMV